MSGTKAGAKRAKATILEKYGKDYFIKLGKMGGVAGTGHKFAHGKLDPFKTGKLGGRPRNEY